MSRPLLEAVTRRRVQQTPNIDICVRSRVTRLVASRDTMRVEAVRYDTEDGAAVTLEADLVVEASGRCGLTLQAARRAFSAEARRNRNRHRSGLCEHHRRAAARSQWRTGWAISCCRPHLPAAAERSCFRSRSSDGCFPSAAITAMRLRATARDSWISSGACAPPTIYDAVRDARPVTDIVRYQLPCSIRRHFERLKSFPAGLLATGDALCRFNPVFGQGMSVAAQEAVILDRLLADRCPYGAAGA